MFFSEIGDIRSTLCTIEACTTKEQVVKHLETIKAKANKVIIRIRADKR